MYVTFLHLSVSITILSCSSHRTQRCRPLSCCIKTDTITKTNFMCSKTYGSIWACSTLVHAPRPTPCPPNTHTHTHTHTNNFEHTYLDACIHKPVQILTMTSLFFSSPSPSPPQTTTIHINFVHLPWRLHSWTQPNTLTLTSLLPTVFLILICKMHHVWSVSFTDQPLNTLLLYKHIIILYVTIISS